MPAGQDPQERRLKLKLAELQAQVDRADKTIKASDASEQIIKTVMAEKGDPLVERLSDEPDPYRERKGACTIL